MKKLFFLVLLLVNINVVNAEVCDSQDMARAKELASNVSYSSNYIGNDEDYQLYEVSFSGLTGNNFYIMDSNREKKVMADGEKLLLDSGNYLLDIFYETCDDMRIKSIRVELPKFNEYSLNEECNFPEFAEHEYCDKWFSGKINDDIFYNTVDKVEDEEEKKINSTGNEFIDFIIENKYVVGGGIALFFIVIIILIV